jgi:hypothetical protein
LVGKIYGDKESLPRNKIREGLKNHLDDFKKKIGDDGIKPEDIMTKLDEIPAVNIGKPEMI